MKNESAEPNSLTIASIIMLVSFEMNRLRIYDPRPLGPCMIHQRNWRIHSKAVSTIRGRNLKAELFISTVRLTIQTNRNDNGAFRKRSSNRRNSKRRAFWKRNLSPQRWCHNNHVISLSEFSSNANPAWLVIVGSETPSNAIKTPVIDTTKKVGRCYYFPLILNCSVRSLNSHTEHRGPSSMWRCYV